MTIPDHDAMVVAPTPTPFGKDDSVDYDALSCNIQRWLETPLTGLVLGTGTGEELALSEEEKIETVGTVSQIIGSKRLIIAGIDSPSTTETLQLAHRYARAGAHLIRVRVPRRMQPQAS